MNRTQFQRILAIYIAGLALLAFISQRITALRNRRRKPSHSSRTPSKSARAYAAVRDEDESSLPVHDHEMIQKSFPLTRRASLHRNRQRLRLDRSRRRLRQSSRTRR